MAEGRPDRAPSESCSRWRSGRWWPTSTRALTELGLNDVTFPARAWAVGQHVGASPSISASVCCAMRKAVLAAGTPQ
jgi:hypothetical protein